MPFTLQTDFTNTKDNGEEKEMKTKDNELDTLSALIEKTDKANPHSEDLKAIQKYLDNNATLVHLNDFSKQAFSKVIDAISTSALMKELLQRQVEEKRESFGYKTATIFEQMLIDQVILCHLRLNNIEITHLTKLEASHSLEHGLYWDKRLNSAQKRFTKACETLAKVKKLTAEAELKEQQARNKRGKGAIMVNQLLKDLTS